MRTTPDITKEFHARPHGRFTEMQGNLRRKKLQRTNKSSNLLGGSFGNRDNIRAPIQLEEKANRSILKDEFFPQE